MATIYQLNHALAVNIVKILHFHKHPSVIYCPKVLRDKRLLV